MARQAKARRESTTELPPFGTWLRELRQKKGVPLRVVAAFAEMDSTLVSKIETGKRLPTETQARALAVFFGVSEYEMMSRRIAERFLDECAAQPADVVRFSVTRIMDRLNDSEED